MRTDTAFHSQESLDPGRTSRGFTILELIVAFTIFALIATVIYSSLRIAVDIYTKSQTRIEKQAHERVLKDYARKQLGSLFPLRPTASFLPQDDLQFDGDNARDAVMQAQSPLFAGTAESLTFITVAPFMHLRNPGLTVVRYGKAEDELGEPYLGAMETGFNGLDSFNYMAGLPTGKPLAIVSGVKAIEFSYYGYDAESDSFDWFDEWSGEVMGGVPAAVRIDVDEVKITVPVNATAFGVAGRRGRIPQQLRRLFDSSPQRQR